MTEVRLFDIPGAVVYLREIGLTSANTWMVRTAINAGKLPVTKIGRKFYLTRVAIDAWVSKAERRTRQ